MFRKTILWDLCLLTFVKREGRKRTKFFTWNNYMIKRHAWSCLSARHLESIFFCGDVYNKTNNYYFRLSAKKHGIFFSIRVIQVWEYLNILQKNIISVGLRREQRICKPRKGNSSGFTRHCTDRFLISLNL